MPPRARARTVATAVKAAGTKRGGASAAASPSKRARGEAGPSDPPPPPRGADGRLRFAGAPANFGPRLTPEQVIRAGSFGGIYFNARGGKVGVRHTGPAGIPGVGFAEFPPSWFEGLDVNMYAARRYDASRNRYGVVAGKDQAFWETQTHPRLGPWIHPQDPRGWFQWYCRYYCGRRSDDDARQFARWRGVAADTGRFRVQLANRLARAGLPASAAPELSPVICQTLLHWADELVQADVDAARRKLAKAGTL